MRITNPCAYWPLVMLSREERLCYRPVRLSHRRSTICVTMYMALCVYYRNYGRKTWG